MSNTVSRQQWVFKTIYLGAWNLVIESPFSSEKCQEESALRTPCQFGNQVVLQFWWSIITPNLSKRHKISGSSRKTVRLASAGTVGCKGSLVISLKLLQVLGWIIIYIAGKGKCSEKLSMDVTLSVFLKSNTSKCPIVYQAYKMTTIKSLVLLTCWQLCLHLQSWHIRCLCWWATCSLDECCSDVRTVPWLF